MTQPRPIYCHLGPCLAAYRVKSSSREAVTCAAHLAKTQRWAGRGARTEPLEGHAPPPQQLDLFAATPQEDQ